MKEITKKILVGFSILFLLISLIYVCNINNLPSNIILFEGETLKLNTVFGINIETEAVNNRKIEATDNDESIEVSAHTNAEEVIKNAETINLSVKLLGTKVKEINVNIIENMEVVPVGNLIGVKLYTNGVLVVGMSEISGTDNNKYKPYEGSGIEEGDVIVEVNKQEITCTAELTEEINNSKGEDIEVKYVRDRTNINIDN